MCIWSEVRNLEHCAAAAGRYSRAGAGGLFPADGAGPVRQGIPFPGGSQQIT